MITRQYLKLMIKLKTLLLLTFACSILQAQHLITLKPAKTIIPARQFYVAAVLDSRLNQETIGFVQKGLSNKRIEANFKGPFIPYLQRVFNQMVPVDQSMTPIIANIHNLYISETTTFSKEIGKAEIAIEFLSMDTLKSYGVYHTIEQGKGIDVTKKHNQRIVAALEACLHQLAKNWTSSPQELPLSTNTSFDPNQPLAKGVYNSFSDLRSSTPTTDTVFEITQISKKRALYNIQVKGSTERLKGVYGVSDGQNFYLNAAQYSYQNHFVKAAFTGTYYYFEDKVSDTGAAVMFGLIGALASNKKVGFVLDTQTGMIYQLNRDFLARVLKNFPDLRKMYNESSKDLAARKAVLKKFNEVLAAEEE